MTRFTWAGAVLAVAAMAFGGCGDDNGGSEDAGMDSGTDGGADAAMDAAGDAEPDTGPTIDAGPPGESHVYVISALDIGRSDPEPCDPRDTLCVAPGLNLDDRVDEDPEGRGCATRDSVSPDGVEGVDNNLALITPILESDLVLGGSIADLFAEAIAAGDLVIMMEVDNVQDLADDETVRVDMLLGMLPEGVDAPMLVYPDPGADGGVDAGIDGGPDAAVADAGGADAGMPTGGTLASGQTFDVSCASYREDECDPPNDPDMLTPRSQTLGTIAGGEITAGPTTVIVTLTLDDGTAVPLQLFDTTIIAQIAEDGLMDGLIAGSLSFDSIVAIATSFGVDESTIRSALAGVPDLNPDDMDICQNISVGLVFEAVPAMKGIARQPPAPPAMDGGVDGGT